MGIVGDERGGGGILSTLCGSAWRGAGEDGGAKGELSAGLSAGHASQIRRTFRIFLLHAAWQPMREATPGGCAAGPLATLRRDFLSRRRTAGFPLERQDTALL